MAEGICRSKDGISLPRLNTIDEASTMAHKPIGMLTLANTQSRGSPLHKVDTLPLKRKKTYSKEKIIKDSAKKAEFMSFDSNQSLIQQPTLFEISSLERKIQDRRKIKHEDVLSTIKKNLNRIDKNAQEELANGCKQLQAWLLELDARIVELFSTISEPMVKSLDNFTLEEMKGVRDGIDRSFNERRRAIRNFENMAVTIESKRANQVASVLFSHSPTLHSIAFLLPNEIEKLLEDQALEINMAILANKRHSSMLSESLIKADLKLRAESMEKWDRLLVFWSEAHCQQQERKFKKYMNSNEVLDPQIMQRLTDDLQRSQKSIVETRTALLSEISEMKLSRHNKLAVNEWKERYLKTERALENIHSNFLSEWQLAEDSIIGDCERVMIEIRDNLIERQILEQDDAYKFLTEKCLPLVEHHQSQMTQQFNQLQRSLDCVSSAHNNMFLSLCQYMQGAAHTLDTYMADRDACGRGRDGRLGNIRKEHDAQNQTMEANLDLVLDRLRQSGLDEELKEYFKMAMDMLNAIKEKYIGFHNEMVSSCLSFPSEISEELEKYDKKLCEYFGVDRSPPIKKKIKVKQPPNRSTAKGSGSSKSQSKPHSRKDTPLVPPSPLLTTPLSDGTRSIISEILTTSNGTSFYILCTKSDSEDTTESTNVFVTQDEESENVVSLSTTKALVIEDSAFVEARRNLCVNFLEHLEGLKGVVMERGEEEVREKVEEIKTELELRLHLHKPRPLRVKQDIRDVRKAELDIHKERIGQHVKAVTSGIQLQREVLQHLPEELEKMYRDMSNEMNSYKAKFSQIKSTLCLENVQSEAKHSHKQCVKHIEEMLAKSRRGVCEDLQNLVDANAEYKASLKLFSQGGNYCQSEIVIISTKLDKQTDRLRKAERTVTSTFDGLESGVGKRSSEIYTTCFGTSYHHHMTDLELLRNISSNHAHCQLLIKTEVSSSNCQSQALLQSLTTIKEYFHTERDSNLASDFIQMLTDILQPFHEHAEYLYCKSKGHSGSHIGPYNEVGMSRGSLLSSSLAPPPISAINLSKGILSSTGGSNVLQNTNKSIATETMNRGKKSVTRRKQQLQQIDRRNISYGVGGGEDGMSCFLPLIRSVLKSTHANLYDLVEDYYRVKGSRPITRSEEIPDTMEQMMDIQIDRLNGYRVQAEEYRRECVDELHKQLGSLYSTLDGAFEYLFKQLVCHSNQTTSTLVGQTMATHAVKQGQIMNTKRRHDNKLRSCLGHPSRELELTELCAEESKRFRESLEAIIDSRERVKTLFHTQSRSFVRLILKCTSDIVKVLDQHCLSTDDIIPPRSHALPTEELLRSVARQQHNKSPGNVPDVGVAGECIQSHRNNDCVVCPGITDGTLAFGCKEVETEMQASVKLSKLTVVHRSVLNTRDSTVKDYQRRLIEAMNDWEGKFDEEKIKEERVFQKWKESVDTIKELYNTN